MDNTIVWMILLTILSIMSGFLILLKGVPYNPVYSTIHKILSFAMGLIYVLVVYFQFRTMDVIIFPLIIVIVTFISFIISVITGSILTSSKSENYELKISHRVSFVLAYGLGIYSLFLLNIF
jgi:hypothetical protein